MTQAAPAELCLGTVQFGMAYGIAGPAGRVPDTEARAILRRASELGIRRLDTAPGYGDIEERLARLCEGLTFEVVSKIPALPGDCDARTAAEFVTISLERSRRRLGAMLCGILFHGADDLSSPAGEAAWQAAARHCAAEGLPLGVSAYDPASLAALATRFPVCMAQIPGNALDQRLADMSDALAGIEITLRSAFLQGLLLLPEAEGARRLPAAAPALAAWHGWCRKQGLAPLRAALMLVKGLPNVRYCAVGVDSAAQLEEIAGEWQDAAAVTAREIAVTNPAIIDPRCWKVAA